MLLNLRPSLQVAVELCPAWTGVDRPAGWTGPKRVAVWRISGGTVGIKQILESLGSEAERTGSVVKTMRSLRSFQPCLELWTKFFFVSGWDWVSREFPGDPAYEQDPSRMHSKRLLNCFRLQEVQNQS